MAGMSVNPNNTKDRSCRRPCKVAGGGRKVGAGGEGQAIIALPATAGGGRYTRIVPFLKEGAGVVTSRGHARTIDAMRPRRRTPAGRSRRQTPSRRDADADMACE